MIGQGIISGNEGNTHFFPSGARLRLDAKREVYEDAGTDPAENGDNIQQWNDLSGNGNHATQGAAAKRPLYSLADFSVDLEGTDDYLDCGIDSSVDITGVGLTIACWVKMDDIGGDISPNQYFISKGSHITTPSLIQYQLEIANVGVNDDYVRFEISNGSTVASTELVAAVKVQNLIATRWYHLATTYDGATMKIYLDGDHKPTADRSTTISIQSLAAQPVEIGRLGDNTRFFDGKIDDVFIYGYALTTTQIKNLYERKRKNR